MKFIKTVAVLLAVSVSLMVPSFAWDSDSFVGQDFYFYEPVINYASQSSSFMAAGDSSSVNYVDSLVDNDFLNALSLDSSTISIGTTCVYWVPRTEVAGVPIGGYHISLIEPTPFVDTFRSSSYVSRLVFYSSISIGSHIGGSLDEYLREIARLQFGPSGFDGPGTSASSGIFLNLDLSNFDSFTTFELSGRIRVGAYLTGLTRVYGGRISVYCNGQLVKQFDSSDDSYIDFGSFIYNSTVPITSISFYVYPPSFGFSYEDSWSGIAGIDLFTDETTSFYVLSGSDVLSGQAGSTQDDVNEIDGLETQWGNSMTENFNALSLDTFTYPDGLTSGFSLISGVFQDLWNAMGSYSILYVLPLTLAVVLLLIGRISKFAGQGRSSPTKEE